MDQMHSNGSQQFCLWFIYYKSVTVSDSFIKLKDKEGYIHYQKLKTICCEPQNANICWKKAYSYITYVHHGGRISPAENLAISTQQYLAFYQSEKQLNFVTLNNKTWTGTTDYQTIISTGNVILIRSRSYIGNKNVNHPVDSLFTPLTN